MRVALFWLAVVVAVALASSPDCDSFGSDCLACLSSPACLWCDRGAQSGCSDARGSCPVSSQTRVIDVCLTSSSNKMGAGGARARTPLAGAAAATAPGFDKPHRAFAERQVALCSATNCADCVRQNVNSVDPICGWCTLNDGTTDQPPFCASAASGVCSIGPYSSGSAAFQTACGPQTGDRIIITLTIAKPCSADPPTIGEMQRAIATALNNWNAINNPTRPIVPADNVVITGIRRAGGAATGVTCFYTVDFYFLDTGSYRSNAEARDFIEMYNRNPQLLEDALDGAVPIRIGNNVIAKKGGDSDWNLFWVLGGIVIVLGLLALIILAVIAAILANANGGAGAASPFSVAAANSASFGNPFRR